MAPSQGPLPPPRPAFHFGSQRASSQSSSLNDSSDTGSSGKSPQLEGTNPFATATDLSSSTLNNGSGYFARGGYVAAQLDYSPPSDLGSYGAYGQGQFQGAAAYGGERTGTPNSERERKMRRRQKPFERHLLDRTTGVDKPWLSGPSSKPHRLSYFLFLFGIVVGVGAGGYMIYSGYAGVPKDSYCQVLSEDFSNGVDSNFWQKEVVMGGTNVDDFTWFTDSSSNVFTADNKLYLLPTFTSDSQGDDLTTSVDLGDACTSEASEDCSASGNDDEIIPPIQSGMLSTRGKVGIKYGRVEITAKMPTGDWLWPRISLVPLDNAYGSYPASGQIDIFLTRGNIAQKRTDQFNNEMSAGLHFGPDPTTDRFSLTQGLYKLYRLFFNDQFYTFGVDWNEDQVFVWINSRVRKGAAVFPLLNLNFKKKTFFQRGNFPASLSNGSLINDPWALSKTPLIAPFDQAFYLRMSVAAGGTDGFWSDDLSKPWKNENRRGVASKSFWDKRDDWFPSWPSGDAINNRALVVDSVKMWKKGSCQ